MSDTASFTAYTRADFDFEAQRRLRAFFGELRSKGCRVAESNSAAPRIIDLYQDFQVHEISATRAINSNGAGRGQIAEILIVSERGEN